MDKLTKEAQEHGEVFEALALFKKSLSAFPRGKKPDCLKGLKEFFADYILAHFQFEERELFPAIFEGGTAEEKDFIRSLKEEHIQALNKVERFKDLALKCDSAQLDESQMAELVKLSKEIIEMTVKHAHKEDTKLFPLLKKYRLDLK